MTLADWFEKKFRRKGEAQTAALERLHEATGISYKSLFYALKGCRAAAQTASRLAEFSEGEIDVARMLMAPTRSEMGVGRTGTDG